MKKLRNVAGACLSAALLAACGGSNSFSATPASVAPQIGGTPAAPGTRKNGVTETVLHSFGFERGTDGYYPEAGLTAVGDTLYGTTRSGGGRNTDDVGTVFSITTSDTYARLYTFSYARPRNGGYYPWAGLTNVSGTLFGAAYYGGGSISPGNGTIFKITPWKKITLYRFTAAPDGSGPIANLTNVGGTLYGTTVRGGASGFGTVFAITQSGRYHQLYSFERANDGCPVASLSNVLGVLYGTTNGCSNGDYGTDL